MRREELHSKKLDAGTRTYFFDVRETSGGNRYMHISEKKFEDGERKVHGIIIFDDHIDEFIDTLKETSKFFTENKLV